MSFGDFVIGSLLVVAVPPLAKRIWRYLRKRQLGWSRQRKAIKEAGARKAWEGVEFGAYPTQAVGGREVHGWPTWFSLCAAPFVFLMGEPTTDMNGWDFSVRVKGEHVGFQHQSHGVVLYRDGSARIVDRATFDLCKQHGMSVYPYRKHTRRFAHSPAGGDR